MKVTKRLHARRDSSGHLTYKFYEAIIAYINRFQFINPRFA
jgi:hypothetical protein